MKKSRLLEIIREEISTSLNEAGIGDQITALDKQIEAATKQISPLQKKLADLQGKKADLQKKEADLSTKTQAQLEEDLLNERPFIDSAFDITGISPEDLGKDPLQNAIDDAVKVLKKENPDADVKRLAADIQKVNSPKNLGPQSKLSSEVKAALQKIADVIEKQGTIFGTKAKIDDLIKLTTNPSQIDRLEKLKEKGFTYVIGNPQAVTAVEKSLGLKPKNDDVLGASKDKPKAEPKAKAEKAPKAKAEKAPKAKKATLTPGDDGFDDVSYSEEDDEVAAATKSISSDPTAKKLGKIAYSKKLTPEEETQYKTALKGIEAKIKRIEDGEEKPDDRTLLKKAYQNSEIQRLFKAKGSNLNDILKGIIG